MAKRVSQQVIAERVGVSQAIVSGVLGGKAVRTSEATRELIFAAAEELGYQRPSPAILPTGPELIGSVTHDENWQYIMPVMRGMRRFFEAKNCLIVQHVWGESDEPALVYDTIQGCISDSAQMAEEVGVLKRFGPKLPLVFIMAEDGAGR